MFSIGKRLSFVRGTSGTGIIMSLLLGYLMVFCAPKAQAQDPHFTQFYANKLYLNPAFAGSDRCGRFVMNYRNQWPGLSGTYVTTAASYDQFVKDVGGLGVMFTNDNQAGGTLRTTGVHLQYAWHRPLTREINISLGAETAYRNRALDWNKLTFGDQIDSQRGFIYPTAQQNNTRPSHIVDFSTGGLVYSRDWFFGIAAHHLAEPTEGVTTDTENKLSRRFTVHGGWTIPLSGGRMGQHLDVDEVSVSPNVIYMRQGKFEEFNFGLYVRKGPIVGGVWYRTTDAVIFTTGFHTKRLRIGYSYDFTINRLNNNASAGSHEVSLQYTLPCQRRSPKWRPPQCSSF